MKKNILSVVIMALCLVNLVLTALLIFTILPTTKKTDNLITQIASVIQLEVTGYDSNAYDIDDMDVFKIEEKMTKNLKKSEDGKTHVVVLEYVTIYMNKKSDSYSKLSTKVKAGEQNSKIMDIVGTTLSQYTIDNVAVSQDEIKETILKEIKKYFGVSDFIVDISLGNPVYQ